MVLFLSTFSTKRKRYSQTGKVAIGNSFSHDEGMTALVRLIFLSLYFITFNFAKLVANEVESNQETNPTLSYVISTLHM